MFPVCSVKDVAGLHTVPAPVPHSKLATRHSNFRGSTAIEVAFRPFQNFFRGSSPVMAMGEFTNPFLSWCQSAHETVSQTVFLLAHAFCAGTEADVDLGFARLAVNDSRRF